MVVRKRLEPIRAFGFYIKAEPFTFFPTLDKYPHFMYYCQVIAKVEHFISAHFCMEINSYSENDKTGR